MIDRIRAILQRVRFTDNARVIVSDILIAVGVLAIAFWGWYVWLGDIIAGAKQDSAAASLSQEWEIDTTDIVEFDRERGDSKGARRSPTPPVLALPEDGNPFATIIIPRFGEQYERTISQSVDVKDVLNDPESGVGHYVSTESLGEVGNFALAGHRTTFGAPFGHVDKLRVGDRIYIETTKGWYVYRFRNIEYVYPTQSAVLGEVPQMSVTAKDRILTMTTCHPKTSSAERLIAYSLFESFVPRKTGTPSEIAEMRRN